MSAAATSFTLVSGTDRDGNALSGLYGFVIDPDNASREYVLATISGTTGTVVYRGIDADAPNTEISANKKAHRRGAVVKISDYPLLGVLRNQLNGEATIPNILQYASSLTPSGNDDIPNKAYVDGVAVAGASNANTTTKGIVEEATQAEVEAGTTTGGTGAKLFVPLDKNGARLYFGYAADAGSNDTYAITCSPAPTAYTTGMVFLFKANTANTGAATINANSLGSKSLRLGGSTTLPDNVIRANSVLLCMYNGTEVDILSISDDSDTAATAAKLVRRIAGGQITVPTTPSASTDAASKSYVTTAALNNPKNGVTTYDATTASGTQTIAHGLGVAPKYIRITCTKYVATAGPNYSHSFSSGVYNGTTNSCVYVWPYSTGTQGGAGNNNAAIAAVYDIGGDQTAVASFDATNITLTWTKTSSPTGTINIMWEAFA